MSEEEAIEILKLSPIYSRLDLASRKILIKEFRSAYIEAETQTISLDLSKMDSPFTHG